jgi:hypothetical protein
MLVYTTMLATVLVKPKARMLVYAVLYIYFWQLGEGEPLGSIQLGNANSSRPCNWRTQRPEHRHGYVRRRAA